MAMPIEKPDLASVDEKETIGDAEKNVPEALLKHSHDADAALTALEGKSIALSEETNRRLLRKIDLHLMPILCVVYGLNYLDKTTLSYASVMGLKLPKSHNPLKSGIGINGDQYSWLGSIFYFGYIAWEYPTNLLLQRLPLGKYSAFNIIVWGGVLCCFAGVDNFAGAVAIRFFLGVFEAAVTPGFALLTSQWYTRKEQGTRTGIWISANGFAQIFGGVLAYGIAVACRKSGTVIEPWKIVFLATGLLTTSLGVLFWWIVPDNQMNARWLTPDERVLAIERIRINGQGVGNKHFKFYQFKEALLDPASWAFFFYAVIADIPNGGLSNFFSQLIVGFGYTPEESLLYGTPGGAVEIVALIGLGWLGDRLGRRSLVSMIGLAVALVGVILMVALPLSEKKTRLGGYYLTQASPAPFVALLSLISSNIAGYTKKTTVAAMYLIGYCAGNIVGPQTYRPKDAPRYVPAEVTIIVCWVLCLCILAFVHFHYAAQNRKKAAIRAQPGYVRLENQEWLDLTDKENPEFVYTL